MDKKDELKQLEEATRSSLDFTRSQLQSIESNLLLSSLFSLFVPLGASFLLNILVYWIPASFLLMLLWTFFSFFRLRASHKPVDSSARKDTSEANEKQKSFQSYTLFRNFIPILNAIAVMFGVTLVALLLFASNVVVTDFEFPKTVAIVSTCLVFLMVALNYRAVDALQKQEMTLADMRDDIMTASMNPGCNKGFVFLLLTLALAALSFVIFPLWSLKDTYAVYATSTGSAALLILVLVMQSINLALFSSYFSSISLRKELLNTVTNLSILDSIMRDRIMKGIVAESDLAEFKRLYLMAKRYEFAVDDTMKIVNAYFLIPSKIYFDNLK